jgi:hypothetical protein
MSKFYRRLTLAAVIVIIGNSAEAGMISQVFDLFASIFVVATPRP